MAFAQESVVINRPARQVFDFLLDGENNPVWRPACIANKRLTPKPDSAGSRFAQQLRGIGGRRLRGTYELVTCTPDRYIEMRGQAGLARAIGTYEVQAVDTAAARVTFSLCNESHGLRKLVDGLIERHIRREVGGFPSSRAISRPNRPNELGAALAGC